MGRYQSAGRTSRLNMRVVACAVLVTAAAVCLTGGAASTTNHASAKKSVPLTDVNIVIASTAASSILPKFAQVAEIFRHYHINAKISFLSSSLALTELATGQAQFGDFGAPQPEEARNSGAQLRWVGQWVLRSNLQLVAAPGNHLGLTARRALDRHQHTRFGHRHLCPLDRPAGRDPGLVGQVRAAAVLGRNHLGLHRRARSTHCSSARPARPTA